MESQSLQASAQRRLMDATVLLHMVLSMCSRAFQRIGIGSTVSSHAGRPLALHSLELPLAPLNHARRFSHRLRRGDTWQHFSSPPAEGMTPSNVSFENISSGVNMSRAQHWSRT